MHELSLARAVLEAARAEMERHPGRRPVGLGLRVGAVAGVDPASLRFCFEVLVEGTEFGAVGLQIESVSRRQRCARCDLSFTVVDYETACPACGSPATECVSGQELELAFLELEELSA